jgi:hypothetical protein
MAATAYSTALLGGARPAAAAAVPPSRGVTCPLSASKVRNRVGYYSHSTILGRNLSGALTVAREMVVTDAPRLSLLRVKASDDDTSTSGDELIEELKAKWDAVENKSTVLTYAGGAIVAVWLASVIVGAVNSVPLVPCALSHLSPALLTCAWRG